MSKQNTKKFAWLNYVDSNLSWQVYHSKVLEFIAKRQIIELFPDCGNLDLVERVNNIPHKNVLNHTVEVLENLYEVIDASDLKDKIDNINCLVLATALHDIGKAKTKAFDKEKSTWTYYRHEEIGAQMAMPVLKKLGLPHEEVKNICRIIEHHQLPSQLTDVSDKGLRRLIKKCSPVLTEILFLSRADCTSNNPMKKLAAKQRIDDLEFKIEEFEKQENIRTLRIPISPTNIKDLLQITDWKEVEMYGNIAKDLVIAGVIKNEDETLQKALEIIYKRKGNSNGNSQNSNVNNVLSNEEL